jgi:hypothetical protein
MFLIIEILKMGKRTVLIIMFLQVLCGFISGQTALKLPEILTKAEKRITINCLLSKTGYQLLQPWTVYSDRDCGDTYFGDKYYVIAERETELHICKAAGCKDRKLLSSEDMGWRSKSDLFVLYGADFTQNSLIHKKCVILNHHKTIERIKSGEVNESEVPLYKSSTDKKSSDHVPLYLIYFVYKTENNRYLLGKDYKFDPDQPFSNQIIGWVDRDRVFDYNNRICFEPNFEESSVAYRRCHPAYAARVFEFESDLARFLKGDTTQKPIWKEPNYYFFRNPDYRSDNPGIKEPFDLPERKYSDLFLKKLCDLSGNPDRIRENNILTGRPLPGNKFRFPLIRMENLPDNMFITGVTGRFANDSKTRSQLCDALRANKSQIAIYFILDNSIDRNRLTYVIGQIQQGFTEFHKQFGVCFFPRLQIGQYKIPIGEQAPGNSHGNYQYVRDFIRNYSSAPPFEITHDNVLNTIISVLKNEPFDARQTNILVVVNNHPIAIPDTGLASIRREIQDKIVEKNCYLLVFDYKSDNNLVQQIQEISTEAAQQYASKLNCISKEVNFKRTEIGYELENGGLLSIIEQADSSQLAAVQMQSFLQKGYVKIVSTINNAIQQICTNISQQGNPADHNEDPFQKALKAIPGMEGRIEYIRALEEGFSAIKIALPADEHQQDIWKANVLMTKPELEALATLLDKMLVLSNNSSFSKSVYDLWIALFNRFVGDNLLPAELLPMTPQVIMGKILGEAYGYNLTEPIKRFTLERILANDQEVQKYFDGYRDKLTSCKNNIREILTTGRLKFSLAEDAVNANQAAVTKGIYYYWVPMDMLP